MLLDISLASGLLRVGHASQSLLLNWFDLLSESYIKKGESLNWVQKFSLWRCSPEEAAQFNPEMSVMEKDPGIETAGGHLKRSQAAVIISTTFRFCWQEQGMGVCLEAAGANLGSLRKPIWVLVLGGEEQAEELPPLTKLLLGNHHVKPGLANDKKLLFYLHLYCLRDMCTRENTDYTGKWNSAISVQPNPI